MPQERDEGRKTGDEPRPVWQAGLREAGPYLGLGMQLALSIVVFTGLGLGADLLFGSMPWGTIAGALLGMVAMFIQLLRVNDEMGKKSNRERRAREAAEREP